MATPSFHRPLLVPPPLPFGPLGSLWEPSWGLRGCLGSPWGLLGVPGGWSRPEALTAPTHPTPHTHPTHEPTKNRKFSISKNSKF